MGTFQLPAETHIGHAHFYVGDLSRSIDFYGEKMGFKVVRREGDHAVLSADGATPHILLTARAGWQPKPKRTTGLYHVAIRVPSRGELARVFQRLVAFRVPFGGFSDHAVSEALYLDDPDGNGLEIYRDRPRSEWRVEGNQVQMTTMALDVHALLDEADVSKWDGIDAGTDIGHVHLHVSNLEKAKAFWVDLIGFEVAADWSGHGALFVSAGGYHHHLGLNIWAGSRPQPTETLGLHSFTLQIPEAGAWEQVRARLEAAGVAVEGQQDQRVVVRDGDGNAVELVMEPVHA